MDRASVIGTMTRSLNESPDNLLEGKAVFDTPLIGICDANDPLFQTFRDPSVIGPWHMTPDEWLLGAKSVISFFFPFSEAVRRTNRGTEISFPWLYGRIEGQALINRLMKELMEYFHDEGAAAVVPSIDPRFQAVQEGKGINGYEEITDHTFGSRWSERHAAYASGLGTFGLSKGLITKKGVAGRFASIITDEALTPDERPYSGIYDYCTKCGACIKRCPVQAISLEHGKDHMICSPWLDETKRRFAPRYGCGLCQTAVPCESRAPRS